MKIGISVHSEDDKIPQVINGTSANTMFWFINYENINGLVHYGNYSFPSLPRDLDDFGRCVLASNALGYTETDIEQGYLNIKKLNQPQKYSNFFKKFLSLKREFESGNTKPVKDYLDEL